MWQCLSSCAPTALATGGDLVKPRQRLPCLHFHSGCPVSLRRTWLHQKCSVPSRWNHLLCSTDCAKYGYVPGLTKIGMVQLLFKNMYCRALCRDKDRADSRGAPRCVKSVVILMPHGQSVPYIATACSIHIQRLSWKCSFLDIKILLLEARPHAQREAVTWKMFTVPGDWVMGTIFAQWKTLNCVSPWPTDHLRRQ